MIDYLSPKLVQALKDYDKPYHAKALRQAIDDFGKEKDIFHNIDFNELEKNRPNFLSSLLDTIVQSYSQVSEICQHNGEVLLYCSQYILLHADDILKKRVDEEYKKIYVLEDYNKDLFKTIKKVTTN